MLPPAHCTHSGIACEVRRTRGPSATPAGTELALGATFIVDGRRMTPTDSHPGSTATILVVEDDADTREFIVMLLGLAGYQTLEAGSGAAALSMIAGQPVQAITLD